MKEYRLSVPYKRLKLKQNQSLLKDRGFCSVFLSLEFQVVPHVRFWIFFFFLNFQNFPIYGVFLFKPKSLIIL